MVPQTGVETSFDKIMADAPRLGTRSQQRGKFRTVHGKGPSHDLSCETSCRQCGFACEAEHLLFSVVREEKDHFKLFFPLADSKDTVWKQLEKHLTTGDAFGFMERILPMEELPPFRT